MKKYLSILLILILSISVLSACKHRASTLEEMIQTDEEINTKINTMFEDSDMDATINVVDNTIIFSSPDCIIVGRFMEDIEDYAIDAITQLVDNEFESICSVSKNSLMQLLDRLSLFVGTYDKNAIHLTFTQNGLQVSSKAANGIELIDYVKSDNFKDYTCAVDIQMLINEVKSIQNDVIEIHYGEDTSIKMVDGNITIIIALLDDDDE